MSLSAGALRSWAVWPSFDGARPSPARQADVARIRAQFQENRLLRSGVQAPLEIRPIDEKVGHGLFARADLAPGTLIGLYTGVATEFHPGHAGVTYLFGVPRYPFRGPVHGPIPHLYIDAAKAGNELRFVNHSSTRDNVDLAYGFHDGFWAPLMITNQPVRRGDQLLIDYGADYWEHRAAPAELA